ncbi:MAG: hypothetical protein JEZ03_10480 [Bacteroidales bacterium]|nr:hypothetical protein [Bacteroidales bacterium]
MVIIMTLLISGLCFYPVAGLLEKETISSCCVDHCNDSKPEGPKSGECSQTCNPFVSCSCHISFIPVLKLVIHQGMAVTINSFINMDYELTNSIAFRLDRPPKA